jgi:hypothetical protein
MLRIDTEGYDYNILKQLDFNLYKPSIINMEYYLLPINEQRKYINLLKKHEYIIAQTSTVDIIAVRRDWAVDCLPGSPHKP